MADFDSERAALITGGSSGIGLAIARMLGELGYRLTISGRRPEKLEAAAAGLREAGVEAVGVPARADDEQQIADLVAAHRDRFGRLDVLVGNAGVGVAQPPDAVQAKHLDLQLAVNVRGLVLLTREALPLLRKAGAEHGKALIVHTASITGKAPDPALPVYSATKAAVVAFAAATQRSVESDGIQVTAICPGFVDADMTEFVRDRIGQGEMLHADDIAEAVRFLLRTSPNCRVPDITLMRPAELHGLGL